MLGKELLTYVDHTLLRPIATWDEIKVICEDALTYHTASVCIPPDFVASAHNAYPELNVCTVIGFEEKIELCRCVTEGGADFIKTSTGFGSGGATLEDVQLFKKHIGPNIRIKAAGGIRSIADMKAYIAEGCSRIGASAAVELLKDHLNEEV